ncbi:MAG TPA: glutathione S-transferase family protein [Rhodopila sp.]|nr:glutathione S-transferase family protein [Rhodopila sp.]
MSEASSRIAWGRGTSRIVWGRATSSNVMKVLWGLGELDLPFERIDVGGAFGQTDTPEYRGMNPTGLVPTLQEGSFTLWESNAILRYLAHVHAAGSPLWPADARVRADIDRWMDAQQTVLNRPMTVVFWGLVRTAADKRDLKAIEAAIADTAHAWRMIEAKLEQHDFIAGRAFSLCDIPWGVHAHRWFGMDYLGLARPELPALRAWYDRLCERPAYQQQVMATPVV